MSPLTTFELTTWLAFLILQISGDIEINPGPNSNESSMSSNVDLHGIFKHKLSIVHLNVQSLQQKTDIIQAELDHFDIIALTETWLNDTIDNNDLALTQYHPPIRKDRTTDRHGGEAIYIKDTLPVARRPDLEPQDIECVWVDDPITNKIKF